VKSSLTDTDLYHLQLAEGWRELGDWRSALAELEHLAPEQGQHPLVLKVRWWVGNEAGHWAEAIEVARQLTQQEPDEVDGWWMCSFALHELNRTQEACDNLSSVQEKFADHYLIHYNLACYLVQMGRIDEARPCLKRAFELEPKQKAGALQDKDLEPLWDEIRGLTKGV
jgi:predicted Zn-dependent protease